MVSCDMLLSFVLPLSQLHGVRRRAEGRFASVRFSLSGVIVEEMIFLGGVMGEDGEEGELVAPSVFWLVSIGC